jgi:hypothetical protein
MSIFITGMFALDIFIMFLVSKSDDESNEEEE